MKQEESKPWYKEPLMYLVLGLPAIVVVAGISTVIIASSNPESLVNAPHTKVGFTVQKPEANSVTQPQQSTTSRE